MGTRNETCRVSLGGMAPLVHILVVVATTQMGTLRIEAVQGFIYEQQLDMSESMLEC